MAASNQRLVCLPAPHFRRRPPLFPQSRYGTGRQGSLGNCIRTRHWDAVDGNEAFLNVSRTILPSFSKGNPIFLTVAHNILKLNYFQTIVIIETHTRINPNCVTSRIDPRRRHNFDQIPQELLKEAMPAMVTRKLFSAAFPVYSFSKRWSRFWRSSSIKKSIKTSSRLFSEIEMCMHTWAKENSRNWHLHHPSWTFDCFISFSMLLSLWNTEKWTGNVKPDVIFPHSPLPMRFPTFSGVLGPLKVPVELR